MNKKLAVNAIPPITRHFIRYGVLPLREKMLTVYCNKATQTWMPWQQKSTAKCLVEEKMKKNLQYYHKGKKLTWARRQIKSRFFLSFGSGGIKLRFSAFCSAVPKSSNVGLPGSLRLVMQLSTPSRHFFLPASDFLVLPRPGFYAFSLLLTLLREARLSRDVTVSAPP